MEGLSALLSQELIVGLPNFIYSFLAKSMQMVL
jgi:hypothetical protein